MNVLAGVLQLLATDQVALPPPQVEGFVVGDHGSSRGDPLCLSINRAQEVAGPFGKISHARRILVMMC